MPPSRRDIGDACLHTSLESGNAAHGALADLHRKLVTDGDEAARFLDVAELEVGTDKRRSAVPTQHRIAELRSRGGRELLTDLFERRRAEITHVGATMITERLGDESTLVGVARRRSDDESASCHEFGVVGDHVTEGEHCLGRAHEPALESVMLTGWIEPE